MIGQTLNNRYTITSRLGKGAMGIVYCATDTQTGQEVALKVIASELSVEPEMLERFKREGEALRQLEHPNIVAFIDAFQYGEYYVIVMEYVSGGSLQELLKAGRMPIDQARRIALNLCDALIRSHSLNIIHRDIKPENVLMSKDGTPKLADFGVARLNESTRMTRTGTKVGTPYYMAPEAWKGEVLDAQADIWSLGVMLFEMLANQVPFDGDSEFAVMTKVCTTAPPDLKKLRAEVPLILTKIVSRMLTRDKRRRYQTVREVSVDLEKGEFAKISRSTNVAAIGGFGFILVAATIIGFNSFASRTTSAAIEVPTATKTPTEKAVVLTMTSELPTATEATNFEIGSTMIGEDGATLIYIPAGEFTIGSDNGNSDERPVTVLSLDAFWIDQTEVTNKQYAVCVSAGACVRPDRITSPTRKIYYGLAEFNDFPVIYVDWVQANDYCSFAKRRLPTEAEWEKAARGTDARKYPWGNDAPNNKLLNYDSIVGDTTKVGSYEAGISFYGLYDMAGNVWEWTSSLYQDYPYDANDGRENFSNSQARTLRGGAWFGNDVRSAIRNRSQPSDVNNVYGFRCASDVAP